MKKFSSINRAQDINDIVTKQDWDLLVIGGGITGAGIALDAQSRGLQVVLIEMQDFAAGTSSRSTKLVHGGLRYLKNLEVGMVAEVGKERAIVHNNGPHVTTPEWMVLPIYAGGSLGTWSTRFGLRLYDFLAGVNKAERRRMLNVDETLSRIPNLKREGLKGAGYYVEYRTDDARLTLEVLKEAMNQGAKALNYMKADTFIYNDHGQMTGVRAVDQMSGETHEIMAKYCVNAAGPWIDQLSERDQSNDGMTLHLTKGVHLVFDQHRLPLKHPIYFDTADKRMVFAIPREHKTYVGTTETSYTNDDLTQPRVTVADRDYLIAAINSLFPEVKLSVRDVESSWAGLRPLIHEEGKSLSEISRKDEIYCAQSGLITIAGGKLTGYRKMAETVVDVVVNRWSQAGWGAIRPSTTKHMPISGGHVGGATNFPEFLRLKIEEGKQLGLSAAEAAFLAGRYGSNVGHMFTRIKDYDDQHAALPLTLWLELNYAIDYEMAVNPVDFFVRRTGALYFDIELVKAWKKPVTDHMADRFNWSLDEYEQYTSMLNDEITIATQQVENEHD